MSVGGQPDRPLGRASAGPTRTGAKFWVEDRTEHMGPQVFIARLRLRLWPKRAAVVRDGDVELDAIARN